VHDRLKLMPKLAVAQISYTTSRDAISHLLVIADGFEIAACFPGKLGTQDADLLLHENTS